MYGNNVENINNKNPFFIGTVVDNNDPTYNYRVKVRLPKIHDTIPDDKLPWAARIDRAFRGIESDTPSANGPQNETSRGGKSSTQNNSGQSQRKRPPKFDHCVPEKGTKLLVMMIQNDANALVYLGALYKKTEYTPTDGKYLESYGIYSNEDQFIGIDLTGEENEIKVYFIGHVDVDKVKKITVNAEDDITIMTKTNVTVKAEADVTVECRNLTAKVQENVAIECKNMSAKVGENSNVECKTLSAKASDNATVESPKIELKGDVHITGELKVDKGVTSDGNIKTNGAIDATGDVKGAGKSLSTHIHGNGNNGKPTTAPQ